ncbi:MAG: YczE/YyaS/YitT family protein [Eubacteriaceae bacterium]|jgi:uncharacterized membrane protein YczE
MKDYLDNADGGRFTMGRRIAAVVLGNLLIGTCVGMYRLAVFGVDPYAILNLGLSTVTGVSFGTCMLAANLVLLAYQFKNARETIGIGTLINITCIGYISDAVTWTCWTYLDINFSLTARIVMMIMALLFCTLGVSLYMNARLGSAPYDQLGYILEKKSGGRFSFSTMRTCIDVTCIITGLILCIVGKGQLSEFVGVATVFSAMINGTMIQFWTDKVVTRVLGLSQTA